MTILKLYGSLVTVFFLTLTNTVHGQNDPCLQVLDRLPPTCICISSALICSEVEKEQDLIKASEAFANQYLLSMTISNSKLPYLPYGLFSKLDVTSFTVDNLVVQSWLKSAGENNFWEGLKTTQHISIRNITSDNDISSFLNGMPNTVVALEIAGAKMHNFEKLTKNFGNHLSQQLYFWHIHDTPLRKIESGGAKCVSCVHVNFHRNQIEEIAQDAFWGSSNLSELNLETNKLNFLPASLFDNLNALRFVRLWGNPIKMLSEDTFIGFSNNGALGHDNWQCHCDMKWLLRFQSIMGGCISDGPNRGMEEFLQKC